MPDRYNNSNSEWNHIMPTYIDKLLAQRAQRPDFELAWELGQALNEKQSRGEALSSAETLVRQVCAVVHCDGIKEALAAEPASVAVAAEFARTHGLPKTAAILADAARGVPVPGPVGMSASVAGKTLDIPLPQSKWGATDLTLSFLEEDMDGPVLDFVAGQRAAFVLTPPARVAAGDALRGRVDALAANGGAIDLLRRFAAHRDPVVRACVPEYDRGNTPADWIEVPVAHELGGPADAAVIAAMRKRYGAAAADLLDLYAAHDGAALFIHAGEPGLYLVPIAQWPDHLENVMSWAREVTWNGEPEEMPDYLDSSIPLGFTPGDAERWILVTAGPHAGTVMLSDTDVIDDTPRFGSLREFLAAVLLDVEGVLGNGGYVCYTGPRGDVLYYPMEYRFSTG